MPVDCTHEIALDMAVSDAFPLFTPKGEEGWVPGWRPTYIEPADGETAVEMLFKTGTGEETTFWTCLAYEPQRYHARYLRITPASRIAFVDVRCRASGPKSCIATVSYSLVPLNEAGRAHVETMSPDAFARMIEDWGRLIRFSRSPSDEAASPHFGSRVLHHD
jgi:hypothetical protein